jgi:hypothetical protein
MSRCVSCSDMRRARPCGPAIALLMATALCGLGSPSIEAQPRQPAPIFAGQPRLPSPLLEAPLGHRPLSLATMPSMASTPGPSIASDDSGLGTLSLWYAPPLSALVPGMGQGLLRQQRGVVYLAAEGYLLLRALGAQRDASRQREAYREIARTVARAGFGADRPDAAWEYYERLQYVLESGAFNRTPGAGLTPESDPATFNGSIWRLARETFWRDPEVMPDRASAEYQRALAFYERRAVSDAFRWSWRDAQLEQDLYRQTIERSNESARLARHMVGLLLANHALSLVDAYVSVRLRVFGDTDGSGRQVGVAGQLPLPTPFH